MKMEVIWDEKNLYQKYCHGFIKQIAIGPYYEIHFGTNIHERLLNKPYVNEVTLTGQNPSLKCC